MKKPNRSTVIGIAIAVAVVAGAVVTVREVSRCRPTRDEADMIQLYQADPFVATAPDGGQLTEQYAHTYTCDSGHGNSPTSPGFAEVSRRYHTPAAHTVDQLRQRFDRPAAAGGWRFLLVGDRRVFGGGAALYYCKETGGRTSIALVTSATALDGQSYVDLLFSASPDRGKTCDDERREYAAIAG
jgi:hypothetical protein